MCDADVIQLGRVETEQAFELVGFEDFGKSGQIDQLGFDFVGHFLPNDAVDRFFRLLRDALTQSGSPIDVDSAVEDAESLSKST